MRVRAALGLTLAALAGPTLAALAPQYYEEARRTAPDVIVFKVTSVDTPRFKAFGTCFVGAKVIRAERGTRYGPDETLSLEVPCRKPNADIPASGTVWQDMESLDRSTHGRAFLDNRGQLALDQYDILGGPGDIGDLR